MEMRRLDRRLLAVLFPALLGSLVLLAWPAAANVIPQAGSDEPQTQKGLYAESDGVYVLNATSFKPFVHETGRAWLVEFYNSWCGFCRRFAPYWKRFALSVYDWRDVVSIGVIDCADDDNNPVCREYEVMAYPTVRFFHRRSNNDKLGVTLQKDFDEIYLRQRLIDQLIKDEQDQEAGPNWPNLVPYRNSEIKTLWEGVPDSIKYQFLIFENPDDYVGAEVILDLHRLKVTKIRRITTNNLVLKNEFKVTKFPTVFAIDRNDSQIDLKVSVLDRKEIVKAIKSYLESKGISTELENIENDLILPDLDIPVKKEDEEEVLVIRDKLYLLDLEATLRYSLNNEISLSPIISGEKMTALKNYLTMLRKYFPGHIPGTAHFLDAMKEVVESRSNITGKEFKEQLKLKEKGLAPVYSAPKAWYGCKGSSPTYRGYPCGLWTLFHTLTVRASIAKELDDDELVFVGNRMAVLPVMHGYIKNFFGCTDCAQHFQEMAAERQLFEQANTRSLNDDVLWLWRAHNQVNERLAGDETEDPHHKKIQYPEAKNCPSCRFTNGSWDTSEVLKYLKDKYGNVKFHGINEDQLRREISMNSVNSGASLRKLGWDFTIFDFSICVVLYVISAAILILVCAKFAYKRTYKKRISFQNLFGFV